MVLLVYVSNPSCLCVYFGMYLSVIHHNKHHHEGTVHTEKERRESIKGVPAYLHGEEGGHGHLQHPHEHRRTGASEGKGDRKGHV